MVIAKDEDRSPYGALNISDTLTLAAGFRYTASAVQTRPFAQSAERLTITSLRHSSLRDYHATSRSSDVASQFNALSKDPITQGMAGQTYSLVAAYGRVHKAYAKNLMQRKPEYVETDLG
jgi:hypothetical protein